MEKVPSLRSKRSDCAERKSFCLNGCVLRGSSRAVLGLGGINQVYGTMQRFSTKETVAFYQRAFMCSKKTLLWMASSPNILNFPLTVSQIQEHFSEDLCYQMGVLRRRKADSSQFEDT